jgi:hypothetical protein
VVTDRHGAGIGAQQAGRDVHRGALAGAVRTEQPEDLAAPHVEREVVDGDAGAIALHDVRQGQHG